MRGCVMATESNAGSYLLAAGAGGLLGLVVGAVWAASATDEVAKDLRAERERFATMHRVLYAERRQPTREESEVIFAPYRSGHYWFRPFPDGSLATYDEVGRLLAHTTPRGRR